jgi:hypothetical protein
MPYVINFKRHGLGRDGRYEHRYSHPPISSINLKISIERTIWNQLAVELTGRSRISQSIAQGELYLSVVMPWSPGLVVSQPYSYDMLPRGAPV